MPDDPNKIRITLDEVERVDLQPQPQQWSAPPPPMSGAPRQWGSVGTPGAAMPGYPSLAQSGNFFLKGWVYLSLAGLAGAFLAWAICEPNFVEGFDGKERWGNFLLFPLMAALISVGLGVAEGVVERSPHKAVTRGLLSLVLGLVFGFVLAFVAGFLFNFALGVLIKSRMLNPEHPDLGNPTLWMARGLAWMVFGVSGGVIYGIVGRSGKKCLYGIIGGVIGAGVGGLLFDPICMITGSAGPSRMIGMSIFGACTGLAIGLVESALKDRWLYMSAGPLAGKQFILYKPLTTLGGQQSNDIYLFKDPSIQPHHASIEIRGGRATLTAFGPTLVGGQPVTQHALRSGDVVQIGRYSFTYQEKHQQR